MSHFHGCLFLCLHVNKHRNRPRGVGKQIASAVCGTFGGGRWALRRMVRISSPASPEFPIRRTRHQKPSSRRRTPVVSFTESQFTVEAASPAALILLSRGIPGNSRKTCIGWLQRGKTTRHKHRSLAGPHPGADGGMSAVAGRVAHQHEGPDRDQRDGP
jgi:hypothetical protein